MLAKGQLQNTMPGQLQAMVSMGQKVESGPNSLQSWWGFTHAMLGKSLVFLVQSIGPAQWLTVVQASASDGRPLSWPLRATLTSGSIILQNFLSLISYLVASHLLGPISPFL